MSKRKVKLILFFEPFPLNFMVCVDSHAMYFSVTKNIMFVMPRYVQCKSNANKQYKLERMMTFVCHLILYYGKIQIKKYIEKFIQNNRKKRKIWIMNMIASGHSKL